jgi:uncharacterized membrane protein YkoI
MKISRFVALAVVALLVVGAIGVASSRSSAQAGQTLAAARVKGAVDNGQVVTSDAGNVDEQVGDQNAAHSGEEVSASDTDKVEEQVGDQNAADTGVEVTEAGDGQEAAPTGTPAITADQAKAAAEAHLNAGTATKVELDDENGQLVYSVTIGTSDVKVDAMTGAVLSMDTGQD